MQKSSILSATIAGLAAILTAGTVYGANPNASTPGRVLIDNPTIHNLAFRWLYEGDANADASATVRYRPAGQDAWQEAQPLMRYKHVSRETDVPAFLAGSILDLAAGAEYEVELTFNDPDGDKAVELVKVSTRPEPVENLAGKRSMRVYPEGYDGERADGFASLAEAFAQAQPGDVVILAPGIYRGQFTVTAAGTADAPIVFRGDGRGTTIDGQGDGRNPVITVAKGADHVYFEGLNIRAGRVGIRGLGSRGVVVRRCRFDNLRFGVATAGEPDWDNQDWYIADNIFVGDRNTTAAINLAGRGHVACYNDVDGGKDGIGTQHVRHSDIQPLWAVAPDGPQQAIDIYNNNIARVSGQAIGADHVLGNIRVMRNRVMNSDGNMGHALGARPSNVGPIYFVRNAVVNWAGRAWRFMAVENAGLNGILAYHNTTVAPGTTPIDQHGVNGYISSSRFVNNLFLGGHAASWHLNMGPGADSVIDHNGYLATRGGELIRYRSSASARAGVTFANLQEFAAASGHEANGVMVRPDVARGIDAGRPDLPPRSPAVNAGMRLPNINDGFTGTAPDLGAFERETPVPRFGPRPVAP